MRECAPLAALLIIPSRPASAVPFSLLSLTHLFNRCPRQSHKKDARFMTAAAAKEMHRRRSARPATRLVIPSSRSLTTRAASSNMNELAPLSRLTVIMFTFRRFLKVKKNHSAGSYLASLLQAIVRSRDSR